MLKDAQLLLSVILGSLIYSFFVAELYHSTYKKTTSQQVIGLFVYPNTLGDIRINKKVCLFNYVTLQLCYTPSTMNKDKTLEVKEYGLPIKIEKDSSGGFTAVSPTWGDCYAQGDSIDEVVNEISAVAASLVELYEEEGLKVPLKSSVSRKSTFNIPVLVSQ